MQLSLVIPAFNEAARIAATLTDVRAYLNSQPYAHDITVVDDGSSDGTADVVRNEFPDVHLISYQPNRGKGNAVRAGMLAAVGDVRVFYDADGSTPIAELERILPLFEKGYEVVIGSRLLKESDIVVHQGYIREFLGRAFNVSLKALGLTRFSDTQCGFKGFSANAAQVCFSRQTLERFSFDVEVLYIAQRAGLKAIEVPIRWSNNPESRVKPLRDALPTLRDLLAIRRNASLGRYD